MYFWQYTPLPQVLKLAALGLPPPPYWKASYAYDMATPVQKRYGWKTPKTQHVAPRTRDDNAKSFEDFSWLTEQKLCAWYRV